MRSPTSAKVAAALDRLARANRSQRQLAATRHGLSPLQVELITILADGVPPEPSVGMLAAEVAVRQPTATDSLRALADKGLVSRRHDPTDRRRATFELTATGRRLATDLRRADVAVAAAIAELPDDVQAATLETLLSVIARLVATGTIDVARTCLTCHFHEPDGAGHRCTLLGVDLPAADLRVNCGEHRAA